MTLILQGAGLQTTVAAPVSPVALLDLEADTGVTTSVTPFAGTGTITQLENRVEGTDIKFTSEICVGDVISSESINGIVQFVASDYLLLNTSAEVASAVPYVINPQAISARITTWSDQSENGYDFTQTGTARPIKQTIDGYSAVSLDSVDDFMIGANFADNLPAFTVIAVCNISGAGGAGNFFPILGKITAGGYSSGQGWVCDPGRLYLQENGGSVWYQAAMNDVSGLHIYSMVKISNTSIRIYRDGVYSVDYVSNGGPVTTFTNTEPVRLGSDNGIDSFVGGALYAVRLYDSALSDSDRAAIEAELATRYGITL